MIEVEHYTESTHYAMLSEWWKGHGWEIVPAIMLPGLGVIAIDDAHGPVAAGWVYLDNSCPVCQMEWIVTDPAAPAVKAVKGISEVIDALEECAKLHGYAVMLTSCRQDSLSRMFQKRGFVLTDSAMRHFIKPLTGERKEEQ